MRLPFLRPKPQAPKERARKAAAGADPASVEAARTRARRRLAGAVVLLALGVVGFPILFETQPRPLPVDTPIELPARDSPAAAPPATRVAPRPLPVLPVETEPAPATAAAAEPAPASAAAAVAVAAPPSVPSAPEPSAPVALKPAAVAPPAAPAPAASTVRADDGSRARALLNGGASAPAPGARWVVQVGAYGDATKLREARAKVEKLGLKTYTQDIENAAGKRTRVRVGPFASRDEADAVAAKVKQTGLPAAILAL